MVTPAGTARAEDPLGQMIFLTKSADAVPAAGIHRQAIREKQQPPLTPSLDRKEFLSSLLTKRTLFSCS
ncbi:hypothetical protein GLW04_15145 [Halobacillus litoralis]|uniref:Uncharacterized protein n=1 Tax=Halobacillus litoralis TaxID=45668 RepID=A0A845DUZ8_9BACI|nr:hypothetical protein [Halobacillus litoralis]MYL21236.1 hypothetical protein [Halobacillus litoralis]MYL38311.1 hypothetical protein [Halobacillus litoralis]